MLSIEVSGLKKYYGNLKAVDGIDFTVKKGEVFGLLGPNGAGKTTTIEIMEGLRERDSGDVKILGFDPWKNGYELHKKIGVIPQNFTFFEKTTPREAINYYADLFHVKADADAILREVLLEDMAKHNFESLSGGQKQKTGLALSLVNQPELLFLDEPTTGLDPNARRAIWEVIRGLKAKGKTIILTTHYLDEAQQLSDRVAIMDHGHIVAIGTTQEIIQQHGSGERLEIHGSQQLADYIKENTELQVEYDPAIGIITVALKKKIDALAALAAAEQSGLEWGNIQTRQDSLDDVFIKLAREPLDEQEKTTSETQTGKKRRL
ncbi:MAG: ABC transporter ATP-binding protein [Nitrososphaerota archaeon]|jgi:ABC-2 type transport system ATP-binding protein|uniref:ABC transporter ATP-binding protein n=1 Tax=Candidatus Bathycorpusculum sp. TaxID=2994959 RepID=UPI0028327B7D|nr:ABC transporter ATP-binding protein [Candidatus Termitimicrobium sp.]MCL2431111.1 ABC transporter ATP-binding protein [Candidatus Termitimicrobium sp.]MDR0492630.1 ABC transporter ATP-binding protein [Nitrososphaerota archaeon]